ncbi:hypothetical protein ANANG_G00228820 [Anguilla anguilla]|uniref:Major facilitator superfamily domain-containing protein 4A n=1 Tax=Anguilla anguilla TaxID=7936 RepID=A0A9D3LXU0_ANGAN|nr:hypothetical protein ANANG_G00228820 [Anguilla anguilla]
MLVDERLWTLFKRNCQHTLTYWSVFFSFGLCIAFLGPTILDLRCQTQSTLKEITWVFFSQQFCLLIGSTIGGAFKKTLLCALSALFLSSLMISVIFAIIPLCHNLVKIYQKDSAVFLQALHFFIGFGALVSPLIADPFLSETNCVGGNMTENMTEIMHHLRNTLSGAGPLPQRVPVLAAHRGGGDHQRVLRLLDHGPDKPARAHCGFRADVPGAAGPLLWQQRPRLLDRDELALETQGGAEQEPEDKDADAGGHGDLFSCCQNDNLRGLPPSFFGIHILGGLVLFMTDGIVGAYAGFVYTYAVSPPMALAHKTAGYLASVFWAAITAGRLVSIPLSYRFPPVRLLTVNLAGVITTVLLLLIFYTSSVFLFVGTSLLGLFLSSIFPCMLAYTEDILEYQGCATTVLVTSAGMGEMVMQVLVGSVIHSEGSYSFLLCGMIIGCIGFILFFGLLLFHRMHRNYLTGTSKKTAMVEEPVTDCVKQ